MTITARSEDGPFATCVVTVNKATEYEILEGDNAEYNDDTTSFPDIKCNGDINLFRGVTIDGNNLTNRSDYNSSEGPTIITFTLLLA